MGAYNVAIVGAGIGGLAAAAYLAQAGHDVAIYDRFATPAPVGSGLVVQPVGQSVLDEIGALDTARRLGAQIHSMEGIEVLDQRTVLDVSYGSGFGLGIHRASLFHALLQAATKAGATLITSADVATIDQMHVQTAAQRDGPFDLILNASGARSALSPIRTRPLPYGAIWGTVPWPDTCDLRQDQLQQRYRRADRMIGVLPVGRLPDSDVPVATVFWSLPRTAHATWASTPLDDWKADALELWPEMAPFLQGVTEHSQMTMARYAHGALANPVRGRVVHLGDAAHQTSPQLGQGANMALLDAAALARALRDPDLDIALLHYRRARRTHVWLYQLLSAAFTPQYQSDSQWLPVLRDRILAPLSQFGPVPTLLTRLVRGNIVPPMGSLS